MIIHKWRKPLSEGRWLVAPFEAVVWLNILLIIFSGMSIVGFLSYSLRRRYTLHITWLDVLGLVLGNARPIRYNLKISRYFVVFWTFGFLIVWGTFQGKLYSAFNSKPAAQPITIPQLVSGNYTFLMKNIFPDDLIKSLQIPAHQIIYTDFPQDDQIYEEMLHYPGPVATITNYWQFQDFIKSRNLHGGFLMVPPTIAMNQMCAYFRPQSYLLEPFNRIMKIFHSSGILNKWIIDIAGSFGMSHDVANPVKRISNTEPTPLTFVNMRIIFLSLFILYCLSFAVFLGEILVAKFAKRQS